MSFDSTFFIVEVDICKILYIFLEYHETVHVQIWNEAVF